MLNTSNRRIALVATATLMATFGVFLLTQKMGMGNVPIAGVTVTLNEYYDCDPSQGTKCDSVGQYIRYVEPTGEYRMDMTTGTGAAAIRTVRIKGRGRDIAENPDVNAHYTITDPNWSPSKGVVQNFAVNCMQAAVANQTRTNDGESAVLGYRVVKIRTSNNKNSVSNVEYRAPDLNCVTLRTEMYWERDAGDTGNKMTLQLATSVEAGKRDESVWSAAPGSAEVSPMELYHRLHLFKGMRAGASQAAAQQDWQTTASVRLTPMLAKPENIWHQQHPGQ